jgi:hypothetical protein
MENFAFEDDMVFRKIFPLIHYSKTPALLKVNFGTAIGGYSNLCLLGPNSFLS